VASFDHAEFENRLRDLGALGPCPACGDEEADRLDPTLFALEGAIGPLQLYLAICWTCGYVRAFTPEVLKAEERA
jgi:hypothetical protein